MVRSDRAEDKGTNQDRACWKHKETELWENGEGERGKDRGEEERRREERVEEKRREEWVEEKRRGERKEERLTQLS